MYRSYSSFHFHSSKLYFSTFGQGDKILLMFHGFGHTHKNMRGIEEALAPDFKIYNFDLFFHGFSEWNHSDAPLTHDFWQKMLSAFLDENKIEKFSLLGFSLGGKVALATLELFPEKIENLYLVAPDGLKKNIWYGLSTSKLLRGLFRYTVSDPSIFYWTVKCLRKLNLVDKSTLRFSMTQMSSREKRRRVYYSWTVYKGLSPNKESLIQIINDKQIKTEIYVGKYDRIIRPDEVKTFSDRLHKSIFRNMNSGHNNLLDEVAYHMEKELAKK